MTNLLLLDPSIIESDEPRPPIIWSHNSKFQYEDLNKRSPRIEEAIDFIKKEHFRRNILIKNTSFYQNPLAVNEYLERLMQLIIDDECSIICIDKITDKIAGIGILKILHKDEYSWQILKLIKLHNELNRNLRNIHYDLFRYVNQNGDSNNNNNVFDNSIVLHLFDATIGKQYKGILRKENLILVAHKFARSIGVPTMTYAAFSKNDQERARRCGFSCINTIHYLSYLNKEQKQIFSNGCAGTDGQHTAELYATAVGPKHFMSLTDDNYY